MKLDEIRVPFFNKRPLTYLFNHVGKVWDYSVFSKNYKEITKEELSQYTEQAGWAILSFIKPQMVIIYFNIDKIKVPTLESIINFINQLDDITSMKLPDNKKFTLVSKEEGLIFLNIMVKLLKSYKQKGSMWVNDSGILAPTRSVLLKNDLIKHPLKEEINIPLTRDRRPRGYWFNHVGKVFDSSSFEYTSEEGNRFLNTQGWGTISFEKPNTIKVYYVPPVVKIPTLESMIRFINQLDEIEYMIILNPNGHEFITVSKEEGLKSLIYEVQAKNRFNDFRERTKQYRR